MISSVIVGLLLAGAYRFSAARVQRFAARRQTGPAAVIAGFILRLAVIVAVFFVLALWTPLNILAVALTFVVLFTFLNVLSVYTLMSSLSKDRQAPPSAGVTGV